MPACSRQARRGAHDCSAAAFHAARELGVRGCRPGWRRRGIQVALGSRQCLLIRRPARQSSTMSARVRIRPDRTAHKDAGANQSRAIAAYTRGIIGVDKGSVENNLPGHRLEGETADGC